MQMAKIAQQLSDLIGGTPLLRLNHYSKGKSLQGSLIAKLESFNPLGSAKDRAALFMIDDAETKGLLQPGAVIIEPTSGNTGIGLSFLASIRGYRIILVMPDTMSLERRRLLSALGAELVLTPGAQGMAGAIRKADELAASLPNAFLPRQFDNPANPEAHRQTTALEIWNDTDGKVDAFVATVGTGGTLTGTGEVLKQKNPHIHLVAVEPDSSPVLSGGKAGPHKIQGIGAGFVPSVYNPQLPDEVIRVTDEDAYFTVRELAKTEGLLVGISSGAAVWAASQLAMQPQWHGKQIVVLLPDSGERYLSADVFQSAQSEPSQ